MVPDDNVSPSRRQLLGGLAVMLSGVSGCTTGGRQATSSPTIAITERRSFSTCVNMPTTAKLTNATGEPAIRSSAYSPPMDWERTNWLVTSTSEQEALEYPTGTTGVENARQFLDATDLSAQNVLIYQQTFDSCRSLQLEQLMWKQDERTGGGFEIGMEYSYDEKDGSCPDGDTKYWIATMVRVPDEVEEITRFTAGGVEIGRSDC